MKNRNYNQQQIMTRLIKVFIGAAMAASTYAQTITSAPSALAASNITNTSVQLTWWSVANAVNYNIYIGSTKVGTSTNGWTSFNVTGLNAGTSYTFTVKAFNSANQEGPGSSVTAVTTGSSGGTATNLTAPPALAASNITNNSIQLTWWSVANAVNYNVYNGSTKIGSTTNGWTSFNVTGLNAGTSYTFTIKAFNSSNQEGPGSSVTASTTGGSGGGGTPPTSGCMAMGVNLNGDYQWSADGSDLKIFKTGISNWSTETNPWNPAFLSEVNISAYKMLRFMDWNSTNWSRQTTWSTRTQKTANHYNYGQWYGTPIAYEWMVDLCNRTGKHMWINIPHRADDNYVNQLATLLKNSLNSNINVYVEYSNETWNYTFSSRSDNGGMDGQLNYVQNEANRLGLPGSNNDYKGQSFYVYRSLQIFKIFNDVWGTSKTRLRKVLAYSGNEDVARQSLNIIDNTTYNPHGIKPDIFAVAPYIGDNESVTTANASANFRTKVDQSVAAGGYTQKFKAVVDGYNNTHSANKMVFSIYEAGQHYTLGGGAQKNFNDNPNAYSDYMYMLDKFKPYYNTFMQFVMVAKCEQNDCWGLKGAYGQAESSAPKFRAVKDFAANNNCAVAREDASDESLSINSASVNIYPNPTKESVTISTGTDAATTVNIINQIGTIVKSSSVVSEANISTADLATGIYYVQLTGGANAVLKLVKE